MHFSNYRDTRHRSSIYPRRCKKLSRGRVCGYRSDIHFLPRFLYLMKKRKKMRVMKRETSWTNNKCWERVEIPDRAAEPSDAMEKACRWCRCADTRLLCSRPREPPALVAGRPRRRSSGSLGPWLLSRTIILELLASKHASYV